MSLPTPFDSHRQLSIPNLIVTLGYGDELPVYQRARDFWAFYADHFPGIEFIFYRASDKLRHGEIAHDGRDLLIGTGGGPAGEASYAATGRWSVDENRGHNRRQTLFYDYLLRTHPAPFLLYQISMTSVVDFRGLIAALDRLPATGCYAGMPGRLSAPPELAGLTLCSGANNLFSRDVVVQLRDRYQDDSPSNNFPNDVWQALQLQDVPRRPLPHFSFTEARRAGELADVPKWVRTLLTYGHFHFRIRTRSEEAGLARREDVDPWLQMKIAETLLNTPFDPAATHHLLDAMDRFCGLPPGQPLPPMAADVFYNDDLRTFPVKENDLAVLAQLTQGAPAHPA